MKTCPICNVESNEIEEHGESLYRKCLICNLLWRDPPHEDSTGYYESVNPTYAINQSKQELYQAVLRKAEKYLSKPGSVLDIGCGVGGFLDIAKDRGWETFGIEPVEQLVEIANSRGHSVKSGVLSTQKKTSSRFDLITYWDVLMLVENPLDEIQRAADLLLDDGLLFLRVRNHKVVRKIDEFWKIAGTQTGFKNPAVFHPFNYETATMKKLFAKNNLEFQIMGGALTSGDAYGVGKKGKWVEYTKRSFGLFSSKVEQMSGNRYIFSPTLETWAKRRIASTG